MTVEVKIPIPLRDLLVGKGTNFKCPVCDKSLRFRGK